MGYTTNGKLLEVLQIVLEHVAYLHRRVDELMPPKPSTPFQPTVPNLPSIGPNNMGGIDLPIETPFGFGYVGGETQTPEFHSERAGEPQLLWHRTGAVHEIPFVVPSGKRAEITVHPTPVMGIARDRGTTQVMVTGVGEGIHYLDSAPRWSVDSGVYRMRITDMNIEGGFVWQCWMK